jgi:hypothetical protein
MSSLIDQMSDAPARHRERHTPSGFGFALADSIAYVNGADWDRVVEGRSVFLSRRYLRVLEAAGPEEIRQRYAMIYRGAAPVGVVIAQALKLSGARLPRGEAGREARASKTKEAPRKRDQLAATAKRAVDKAVEVVGDAVLSGWEEEILVCGNLLSWGTHGVAFAEGEDPAALWPAVADALYRIRRADHLFGDSDFVLIKDVTAPLLESSDTLRRYSYAPIETEPNMVVELDPAWKTFDDYLASRKGDKRRALKKFERDLAEAGITRERLVDPSPHAEELHALYMQVHERAAMRLVTVPVGYTPALAAEFGDDFRCTVARDAEGRIVGYITTIRDGDGALGYHVGIDYPTNARAPLYFTLLQTSVADAIALRARRLSLGRTALPPKQRLGAGPQPIQSWLRHRLPVANYLVRALLHAVPEPEE